MKIGVDLISGESPIPELIAGCVDAVRAEQDIEVVLIGKGDVYRPLLSEKKFQPYRKDLERISVLEASEVITMEDDPLAVIRQKKDSSIVRGLQAHKNGEIGAFFSPGNTGAVVVGSALILGRVRGVKKPALATVMPNVRDGANVFLDVGASAECEVDDLVKFAVLGRIYAREMLKIADPRVGLLNIGEEEHKGTAQIKETHKRLKELKVNFIGNIEGRHLFSDDADVIVCDGNIGNIALKTIEGTASAIFDILKKGIKTNVMAALSLPLYKGALKYLKNVMDPEKYGGAPLLGVNGNVFIGHGSSGRDAIHYGIQVAANTVRKDVLGKINREMQELHLA